MRTVRLRCFQFSFFVTTCLCALSPHADVLDSITVPEGFTVTRAAGPELSSYPMFMEFDDKGRLFIAESTGKDKSGKEMAAEPECLILRLEDVDGDGNYDTRTEFATSLSLPMGVLWHQDALYVASPPDFLRFTDTDDDGVADTREVLLTGWNVFNTASLHGPFLGPDGRLYLTHGRHGYDITTKEGVELEGLASRIWRCQPDGTQLERFAGGGFDNPVELIFTNAGEILGTMTYFTDPELGQRDALMHFTWGGVYPKPHESSAEFVRTGDLMPVMTKFARIAPAGMLRYRADAFGADYRDDLFSAQFNPHRVQRHKVFRDGATFRTEDEDFLVSSDPDFYPTDVLEDADGSILVSDTGAWYVDACPISRVSKPEVRGSIYRVSRTGADVPKNPWGMDVAWDTMDTQARIPLLADARFRVRDRALQEIIRAGKHDVPALRESLNDAEGETKIALLSALYQIDSSGDVAPFVHALNDADQEVATVAARFLGDLEDSAAVGALTRQLAIDSPVVRREAAAALGRIGDASATSALMEHAANVGDRFEEHAFIYALIELGDIATIRAGLSGDAPWGTRKAALIALDQLNDAALNVTDVLPFLESDEPALRSGGLWVASHHAPWAGEILAVVEKRLRDAGDDEDEMAALRDSVMAYAKSDAGTAFMARVLSDDTTRPALKRFLLACVQAQGADALPDPLHNALAALLAHGDADIQQRSLGVIRARSLDGFEAALTRIADDADAAPTLRLGAMAVLQNADNKLTGDRLAFALASLRPDAAPEARRAAAVVLGAATLDDATITALANDFVANADALAMTTILSCVAKTKDASVGEAFVDALIAHPEAIRLVSQVQLETVLRGFSDEVQERATPLQAEMSQGADAALARFHTLEPILGGGDVGRGRRIFFSEAAQCGTCHAVGKEGGNLGPDLTAIGLVRTGHDILEAILFPNASIVPDYLPQVVDLEWETVTGIVKGESAGGITLATSVDQARHIARDDIEKMEASEVSLMPEGLDATMTDEQVVDLVTFLQSLNNERWLIPVQRDHGE